MQEMTAFQNRGSGEIAVNAEINGVAIPAILVVLGNHHGATYIVWASAVKALRESGSR